eukprot:jgi/Undpi1/12787/HiC_scaffold_7.g02454.m1
MAILMTGLTLAFTSGAAASPCPAATMAIDVTSTAMVQNLTDVLACSGKGSFSITWHASLTIENTIKVSDNKNVTITGVGSAGTIRGALGDDGDDDSIMHNGSRTGMFSVSNRSTLRLNHLAFEGGYAEKGGAVDVLSSSSLFVFDCTFTSNKASRGGAIFAEDSAVYLFGDTSFAHNSAEHQGGE